MSTLGAYNGRFASGHQRLNAFSHGASGYDEQGPYTRVPTSGPARLCNTEHSRDLRMGPNGDMELQGRGRPPSQLTLRAPWAGAAYVQGTQKPDGYLPVPDSAYVGRQRNENDRIIWSSQSTRSDRAYGYDARKQDEAVHSLEHSIKRVRAGSRQGRPVAPQGFAPQGYAPTNTDGTSRLRGAQEQQLFLGNKNMNQYHSRQETDEVTTTGRGKSFRPQTVPDRASAVQPFASGKEFHGQLPQYPSSMQRMGTPLYSSQQFAQTRAVTPDHKHEDGSAFTGVTGGGSLKKFWSSGSIKYNLAPGADSRFAQQSQQSR
jgi:hypothetical protein